MHTSLAWCPKRENMKNKYPSLLEHDGLGRTEYEFHFNFLGVVKTTHSLAHHGELGYERPMRPKYSNLGRETGVR